MSLAQTRFSRSFGLKETPPPYLEVYTEGLSTESKVIVSHWLGATEHYFFPITRETPVQKFQALATTWRNEAQALSSVTQMAMHPAYQQIIGMGPIVIPLILRELQDKPDHWFWALKAITGVDPVKSSERGRVKQMAAAWLRWAKEQGYSW